MVQLLALPCHWPIFTQRRATLRYVMVLPRFSPRCIVTVTARDVAAIQTSAGADKPPRSGKENERPAFANDASMGRDSVAGFTRLLATAFSIELLLLPSA